MYVQSVCRATAVFCMFSLLVVFLATEPNLFKKESLGNMVTVEAESHHIGVKKNNNTEVQTIGVGFTLLPLSPFLLPPPSL